MVMNFVSVSAVSDRDQLVGIRRIYREECFSFPLVIGYQVSHKSIHQGSQNTRQAPFSELGVLDRQTKECGFITAIHYYSNDNATIVGDLERVAALGINAAETLLQFNTLPPSLEILARVKEMGFKTLFKVAVSNTQASDGGYAVWKGGGVQDISTGNAEILATQVLDRNGLIDYAMFDPSHGTNLDLNLDESSLAIRFGRAIIARPELRGVGLVYAGGIKPKNVKDVTLSLASFFPGRFSIDAESGVRTNDRLDLGLVRDYLRGYQDTK